MKLIEVNYTKVDNIEQKVDEVQGFYKYKNLLLFGCYPNNQCYYFIFSKSMLNISFLLNIKGVVALRCLPQAC